MLHFYKTLELILFNAACLQTIRAEFIQCCIFQKLITGLQVVYYETNHRFGCSLSIGNHTEIHELIVGS